MARPETNETRKLRREYDFYAKYDAALICAFNPGKTYERTGFCDAIGDVVRKLKKRPFIPHRDISTDWYPGEIISITSSIVVPTVDIIIAYLDETNDNQYVAYMLGTAGALGIPTTLMYKDYNLLDDFKILAACVDMETGTSTDFGEEDPLFRYNDIRDLIEFNNEEEALSKLELSLRAFYQ
jgi:hypothetical protein